MKKMRVNSKGQQMFSGECSESGSKSTSTSAST